MNRNDENTILTDDICEEILGKGLEREPGFDVYGYAVEYTRTMFELGKLSWTTRFGICADVAKRVAAVS